MELSILTSKKGTRVLKSTQLHRALGFRDDHYQENVKRWLSDVYQFGDGIRKPAAMTDFARARRATDDLLKEYYFSLEFARLVTLASRSRNKQPLANKLSREEEAFPQRVFLDTEAMLRLLEQTKAMTRFTCQIAAEQRHQSAYERRRGTGDYWNGYRAEYCGFTKDELISRLRDRGQSVAKRSTLRELLFRYDALELIRVGLIDLYASQGHPLAYATEIGRIGRRLAEQMQLEVIDDRCGEGLFATPVDESVMAGIRGVAA